MSGAAAGGRGGPRGSSPSDAEQARLAVARAAARLLVSGEATSVEAAIQRARQGRPGAPAPTAAEVRRHRRAAAESALGDAGYRAMVQGRLQVAEELMTLLEHAFAPATTLLAGRAARGHVDADPTLHVRLLGEASIGDVAAVLVEQGYEEPAFETLHGIWGRLDRIRFREGGVECVITRCPPRQVADPTRDLATGGAVPLLTLEALRTRLG